MEISKNVLFRVLDEMGVARLALETITGRVDAMPIVFARVNDRIVSPIDEKPKKKATISRLSNINANPDVMVLLDNYSSDWSLLWWIRMNCFARVVTENDEIWESGVKSLLQKYPQYQDVGLFKGAVPTMIEFKWHKVRAWAYSGEKGIDQWLERDKNC